MPGSLIFHEGNALAFDGLCNDCSRLSFYAARLVQSKELIYVTSLSSTIILVFPNLIIDTNALNG